MLPQAVPRPYQGCDSVVRGAPKKRERLAARSTLPPFPMVTAEAAPVVGFGAARQPSRARVQHSSTTELSCGHRPHFVVEQTEGQNPNRTVSASRKNGGNGSKHFSGWPAAKGCRGDQEAVKPGKERRVTTLGRVTRPSLTAATEQRRGEGRSRSDGQPRRTRTRQSRGAAHVAPMGRRVRQATNERKADRGGKKRGYSFS